MARIQRLPDSIANKIAAGEVVQRPASVVKELVENAIDAGATAVSVIVKNAGKALIFVQDNGSGMSEEDARLAFERHATSKISEEKDLDRILTLGFRGEALAAIGSVAQVELKTREPDEELGTVVRVENGAVLDVTKDAAEIGTAISVKNLFFSVPARRKFLKSNATEYKHIAETVQAFALSYPGVEFTLSDDESVVMHVEPGSLEDRISAVYNVNMLNALLPFEAETDGLKVTGFIGRPNFARKSKSDQYLFMNGRHITSKMLSHAVYTGYEHLLDKHSYPPYVLFLDVDPERVDVNVHPAKSEVKFDDEQRLYALLQDATRKTLSRHNLTPSVQMPDSETETGESVLSALRYALPNYDRAEERADRIEPRPDDRASDAGTSSDRQARAHDRFGADRNDRGSRSRPGGGQEAGDLFRTLFGDEGEGSDRPAVPIRMGGEIVGEEPPEGTEAIPQEIRPHERHEDERVGMWQLHNKYIITQIRSGLMIVDQHVAHERILYEQALEAMKTSMPMSQQLLFPLAANFPPSEFALIKELRDDLTALGFELSLERGDTVHVHGVPIDVRPGQEESILRELVDQYREYQMDGMTDQRDLIAASFACRASIKAGDKLSEAEMLGLIEQLFGTSMPYVCPHGRPVVIRINLGELDRRFGRTS